MSEADDNKQEVEGATQAEEATTPESTEQEARADESPDKPEDGSAEAETKDGSEDESAASATKSGVTDGPKTKSQAPGAAVKSGIEAPKSQEKPKSGIDAQKSATKSEVKATKSKQSTRTKSTTSDKRRTSSSGSKVEGKPSRGHSGSRSKVDDVSGAKIGFLGAGRMTDSIVKGLLKADKVKAKQLYVAAKSSKNLDIFKVQGVATTTRSYDLFGKFDCDIVFLNVHGFVVRNCFKLGGTRPCPITTNYIPTRKRPIFILSLIGGVPLADVKTVLLNPETANKYKVEMHRLVLNTSVAFGLGLGVLDVELDSKKCNSLVRDALQSLAKIEFMEPDQMDAACALIGNGMAYVYYFISALADGGFKMGLAKAKATKLATKAVQCAAQCLLETNKNPAELRDSVISPSGGAIYGIHVLEQRDCASGIHAAVEASYQRIKELVEVEK